ncbi:MAG TPA: 2-hydroxyacyl-CoA dehydratase [Thermoplasmata archaeon]|nr:2-hydroxyacyl-CoA dehydratase [Thermoplasmata archaeon]
MLEEVSYPFSAAAEDSYTSFASVKRWKEESGRPALGYFPVYFPEELAHAMGLLPVGLYGASGRLSLDMATAHTQSFICSISRSVFQMALQGTLDIFDGLVFSNICDVARNLSGITKRNLKERYVDYLHYPVNNGSAYAARYLREEYLRLASGLEKIGGTPLRSEDLRTSIGLCNEKRRLLRELVQLRQSRPWLIPYTEWYAMMRAGSILPVEQYVPALRAYGTDVSAREGKPMDRIRVVVTGTFCEQPPLQLMRTIEAAGCYIVHDEALIGSRWMGEVPVTDPDPLLSLARSYVENPDPLTVRFHPDIDKRRNYADLLASTGAQGVIICTPKFCEPALYDSVIFKSVIEKSKVPYLHLEYEESASSFEHDRTMVETFVESILFE